MIDAAHDPADVPSAGAREHRDATCGEPVRDARAIGDTEHTAAPVDQRQRMRSREQPRVPVDVDVAFLAVLVMFHGHG